MRESSPYLKYSMPELPHIHEYHYGKEERAPCLPHSEDYWFFFYSLYVLNNLLLTNFPSLVLYKHCQDDDINQKLLERIPRKLCCEVNNNPWVVLVDNIERLDAEGTSISMHTIQHCFPCRNMNGVHGYRPQRTSLHNPCHLAARLKIVKTHMDKESDFWELKLLWMDKTKLEYLRHNNVLTFWRKKKRGFSADRYQ